MGDAGSKGRTSRTSGTSDGETGSAPGRSAGTSTRMPAVVNINRVFHSDYLIGREVQQQILDAVAGNQYDDQSHFAIKLCLEEALINAIKHGNKLDPKKTVTVEAKITAKQTEIMIEDQGGGFDRGDVPDPTAEENLHKCSGRGILLIEAYMDEVEWTKRGRRVRMVKKNAAKS